MNIIKHGTMHYYIVKHEKQPCNSETIENPYVYLQSNHPMMTRQYVAISAVSIAAVALMLIGTNFPVYAINGHGSNWGPTFGGLNRASQLGASDFTYDDGLKINSATFNVATPGVKIPTQTLYVGAHNSITVKIYQDGGPYYLMGGAMLLNVQGPNPISSKSDTFIQWDKFGGVTVQDPHNLLGDVKVSMKDDQHFKYVTFSFIPQKPMKTSDIIFNAWNLSLSVGSTTVIDGINFSYVPQGYH